MDELSDRGRDVLIPNLLSISRVPLAFALWVMPHEPLWTIAIVLTAGVTDVLDGWTVRRARSRRWGAHDPGAYAASAARGAFIDGMADKIFVISSVFLLAFVVRPPFWTLLVLATRELLFVPLLFVYRFLPEEVRQRIDFTAGVPGKVATAAQFAALILGLLHSPYFDEAAIIAGACGILTVLYYASRTLRRG